MLFRSKLPKLPKLQKLPKLPKLPKDPKVRGAEGAKGAVGAIAVQNPCARCNPSFWSWWGVNILSFLLVVGLASPLLDGGGV